MVKYHKKIKTSQDAKEAYTELKSVWSEESALRTWTTILILEKLEILTKTGKAKPKRKQSDYSIRLGKLMRENNISIKDAHRMLKDGEEKGSK